MDCFLGVYPRQGFGSIVLPLLGGLCFFWGDVPNMFFSGGRSGMFKKHSTNERSVEALPRISASVEVKKQ